MKTSTITHILLVCLLAVFYSCKSSREVDSTPATVEEATKLLNKEKKKKERKAKKAQKSAYKAFWKQQTKEARKSIKRNKRRQKRIERARRKAGN
ncbi:MAG: hypothetical protein LW688_01745 [Cryomorphaceae bacterium]|jgi:hypothetical protein|nr:hypothetical protein [Cryomorphaceae bacterium]